MGPPGNSQVPLKCENLHPSLRSRTFSMSGGLTPSGAVFHRWRLRPLSSQPTLCGQCWDKVFSLPLTS